MQYDLGTWDASWTWSIVLMAVTIAIHAAGIASIVEGMARFRNGVLFQPRAKRPTFPATITTIVTVALALAAFLAIEATVWALFYVRIGALPNLGAAELYSFDSMTTRGASGLLLAPHWGLLGAMESTDGLLLFGLSTAFLFAIMSRLWAPIVVSEEHSEAKKDAILC